MNTPLLRTFAVAATLCGCQPKADTSAAPDTSAASDVERTVRAYELALNNSDVPAITALYTADAVFMAQHQPPAEGLPAIETLYTQILSAIALDIRFSIDEVQVLGDTAWARTRSSGTTKVLQTGDTMQEANQELFVLHRDTDRWKIHRYIFSTTTPRG